MTWGYFEATLGFCEGFGATTELPEGCGSVWRLPKAMGILWSYFVLSNVLTRGYLESACVIVGLSRGYHTSQGLWGYLGSVFPTLRSVNRLIVSGAD